MKKYSMIFMTFIVTLMSYHYYMHCTAQDIPMITKVHTVEDVISLFNLTADQITHNVERYLEDAQKKVTAIIEQNAYSRTYATTARALDELMALSNLAIAQRLYEALELLSPNKSVRDAAHDAYLKIHEFWTEQVATNKKMYDAFMAYESQQKETEHLSAQQRYFLNSMMDDFKREGLSLPEDVLAQVKQLKNELTVLGSEFERNISQDNRTVAVHPDNLTGLDEEFIAALSTNEQGECIVGVDYPTFYRVMENCTNSETRRRLSEAFNQRAYPANEEILRQIIAKRDELARLLGYVDFNAYNIDDQMAHTPERVRMFIADLIKKSTQKAQAEFKRITKTVPESVIINEDGTVQPWDVAFITNWYKKNNYNLDEQAIADYFPMEKTVAELLDIYRQFFSIEFKEVPATGLWHEDVTVVQVFDKTGEQLLGTLLLDLYPRANKYSHAAHTTIIPATVLTDGTRLPDVSVVIANFARPTDGKPSLLKLTEVNTFFHEFGHALHAVLGAAEIASLSGTHTKTDFVELPSQMLEEWLDNKDILKKVSGHYQTGEPLPDETIDAIIALKNLTSGYYVLRQSFLSLMALSYFDKGIEKNPSAIMKQLHEQLLASVVSYSDTNHFYAAFGHLMGYGSKYYGYLWSKVFALDIFAEIKKHGLLDPVIGKKYVDTILSKGGAQDPNELLYNFLGREPNADAFFEQLGL